MNTEEQITISNNELKKRTSEIRDLKKQIKQKELELKYLKRDLDISQDEFDILNESTSALIRKINNIPEYF